MADLRIEVAHKLSRDEAVSRLQRILSEQNGDNPLLEDVDFRHEGARFSFAEKVKGFKVSGKMAVMEKSVRMIITLPWSAKAFSTTADEYIRSYLMTALA